MPIRNAKPHTFRARGVSDAVDGSNAFPGAMAALANLIPNPSTADQWVPRPAAAQLTAFASSGLSKPAQVNALLTVGAVAYGMCADTSSTYSGLDVPFAYNLLTNLFKTVAIPGGAASLPTTPAATGDWTPPSMAVVGSRIVVTHPGFAGGADPFFGWLDISGLSDTSHTGSTHSTTLIDSLSSNVLTAGWQPGMTIAGTGIPANTTIVSIAANGMSLTLSQAATATATTVALTVAGGTATAPLWGSGNTNGNPLTAVPVAVGQFNGRAYYAVGSGVVFSDSGVPCQVTNATQALTFNNGLAVTALAGLPMTQSQGGILQALLAFQGAANIVMITGDASTSTLAANNLGIGTGTLAPNTIAVTPIGVAFIAPDGLRVISFLGVVSDPIGAQGQGVRQPFLNAISPSRMCAAYNQDVYRASVQNGNVSGQPVQEYWYHVSRKIWTGPHSFPAALIQPLDLSDSSFLEVASGIKAKLWQSDPLPLLTSEYTENGVALGWTWRQVLLPDNQQMAENLLVQTMLGAAVSRNETWTIIAEDEQGNTLDTASLAGPAIADTIWNSFDWGLAQWSGPSVFFVQYLLAWHLQIIFKQMAIQITGTSAAGTVIGNMVFQIAPLGYPTMLAPQLTPLPAPPQPSFEIGDGAIGVNPIG